MNNTQVAICALALAAIPLGIQQAALADLENEKTRLTREVEALRVIKAASAKPGPRSEPPAEASLVAKGDEEDFENLQGNFDALLQQQHLFERKQAILKASKLAEALGLEEEAGAALKERALENLRREKARSQELHKAIANSETLAELEKITTDSREIEIFDGIEADLNDEQLARYEEWSAEQDDAMISGLLERFAYEDLAELQKLVLLTDEQRQQALDVFRETWNDLSDDGVPDSNAARNPEDQARQEMEEHLGKFTEILTSDQLRIYRQHLEAELED